MPYKSKEQNREYQRKWRVNNRPAQLARNKANRLKTKIWIATLKDKPCTDCGVKYPPYVMEFHHVGDKTLGISLTPYYWGRPKILEEIEKCVLLCANCHRTRTYRPLV